MRVREELKGDKHIEAVVAGVEAIKERVKFLEIWLRAYVAKGFAVSDQVRRQGLEVKGNE